MTRRRKNDRENGSSASASGPAPAARDWQTTEDSFRLLAEHAPVGLYLTDARGDLVYANPRLCIAAALSFDEALGRGWLNGLHEDDRDRIEAEWYEAVARGEPWQAEYRYVDAEGGVTWARGSAGPIRNAAGTILGYAGMDLDVTAVKEAELEASQSRALLADAQSLAHFGSWEWDIAGERLTWSDETYRIFGVDRDFPLTFERIAAAVHLEDRARNNDWVARTLASAEPGEIDLRIVRPDGEVRHVHQTAIVEHDQDGEPVRAVGTIQDVTARKRAQAAARASEARFSALLENADVAVCAIDRDGRLIVGNAAFQDNVRAGLGREARPGDTMPADELPADMFAEWQAYLERALSGERFSIEARRHFGEAEDWMEYRFSPITDLDGNLTGVIAIGRDITESRRAAEELQRLADELRVSEELLRQAEAITHAGGWSYDTAGGQMRWTDEVYRIYGVDRDFDVNDIEADESFYGPDGRDRIAEAFARAVEQGEPYDLELPFVRADGEPRWVRTSARPVVEDGHVVRIAGNIADITERKGTGYALRVSEERFRLLLANANDAVFVHEAAGDSPGCFIEVNEQACRMLGYSRDELLGMEVGAIDVPEQVDRHAAIMQQLYTTGRAVFETRHVARDGHPIPVEVSTRLFDLRGTPTVLSVARDISERLEAERELRESEGRYRELLETLLEGVWAIDEQACTTMVNPAMARMLGYSVEEMLGKPLFDFMDETAVGEARRNLERRARGSSQQHEFRFRRKDGTPLLARLATNALLSPDGSFRGAVAAIEDITARRAAEEALRVSEAKTRAVADFTYGWEYWRDIDGSFLYVSPSCERMTGYTPEEFLTDPDLLVRIIHPDDRDLFVRHHEERLAAGQEAPCSLEFRVVHRSGETRWIGHVCQLVTDDDGVCHGVRGSNRDITEHRRADQALREASERLSMAQLAAGAGMWDWDMTTEKLSWSPEFYALFGLPADAEASFETWRSVLHPDDLEAAEARIRDSVERRIPLVNEYRIVYPDGTVRWIRAHGNTTCDDAGTPVRMSGICVDITEQRQTETRLRESEERLRLAHRATSDVVWDWDIVHDQQRWNEAGTVVFGWTDIVEAPQTAAWWAQRVHPDDRQRVEESFFAVVQDATRDSWNDEYRFRRADGSYAEVIDRGYVLRDEHGDAVRMIGAMLDITERKSAENALRESEERFRTLVDNVPGMVFRCEADPPWQDRFVSDEIETLTGYSAEDSLSGRLVWTDIVLPEDLVELERTMEERRRAHRPHVVTYRIRRRDGSVRWVREIGRYAFDDSGRATHVDGVITDVTDQVMSEEQLRDREERFRGVVETSPTGIVIVDTADQRFVEANESFLKLTGYSLDELSELNVWDITHPDDRQREEQLIAAYAAGEVEEYVIEKRYVRKDGEVRWVRLRGDALHLDPNGPPLAIANVEDITEHRQAVDELRASRERLRATLTDAVKAMGGIVELRDPYTAGHEREVTRLAEAIAVEMGIDEAVREGLVMAAEVHDIGKIAVPAEILSKPSKLTEMEFELVKQHPVVGRQLVSTIDFERPVAQIVGQHHERLDGSGYPDGLKGDQIRLEARILAVADVVEAMASHRPYRPALGIDAALDEIRRGSGTLYDADAVAACERVIAGGFKLPG